MVDFFQGYGLPAIDRKYVKRGEQKGNSKLTDDLVRKIREMSPEKNTRQISEWLESKGISVTLSCINGVIRRNNWRHVV